MMPFFIAAPLPPPPLVDQLGRKSECVFSLAVYLCVCECSRATTRKQRRLQSASSPFNDRSTIIALMLDSLRECALLLLLLLHPLQSRLLRSSFALLRFHYFRLLSTWHMRSRITRNCSVQHKSCMWLLPHLHVWSHCRSVSLFLPFAIP